VNFPKNILLKTRRFQATLVGAVFWLAFAFGNEGRAMTVESSPSSESSSQTSVQLESERLAVNLHEKLVESKKSLIEAETQKRKILGSLYLINQRMKKISSDKSHLTNELFQVQDNVKNIAKIIANLELLIDKQRTQLKHRLRTLYKLSGQSYIGIIFSRTNTSDFDETLRFLKIVTDNDYQLIKSFQENVASYKQQKNKLHTQIEKLVGIEKNIKQQESLLANEHKAKSKIASALDQEQLANLNRIKSLRNKSREIVSADTQAGMNLADLLKPSIYEQKSQLMGPIVGTVVQDFGLVMDEKYRIRLSHKGWRFQSTHDAPVSSIYDGTVIHSAWIQGYGQTLIIDHGDHYYSIYGHISHVKVKTGDSLKKGQVFAEAGPGDHGYGAGLYFEIRHFSEPENPANWILKKQYQQASTIEENTLEHVSRQESSSHEEKY